jgi:uncharacterized protein YoxC
MSFLEKMWKEQRVLTIIVGVILFPIAIALLVLKFMSSSNVAAAEKSIKEAQKTDDKLAAEEDALKAEAASSLAVADKAADRREQRAEESFQDLDWQNKRKD